jgi:ribosomal protein S18 acetylase RimI-like enzyme
LTAAAISHRNEGYVGVRPIDPRRDMGAVADLIESAFPLEFDPEGRRMIHDMRSYSQAGILGYWIGRLVLPPAAFPLGFVWEQDGSVVGNASLLRVDGFPNRWVLANVVVRSDYRRRGIARALTQASIELARTRKAKELFLQVDSTNQGAQILYASLGFHPHGTRTTWIRSANQSPQSFHLDKRIRESRPGDWKAQLELASRLHPEGLVWPYPLTSRLYKSSRFQRIFRTTTSRHWILEESGHLMGTLTARSQLDFRKLRFILVVDPEMRGEIERPLLEAGLDVLQDKGKTINMDYSVGLADEELKELGFRSHRVLTWMSTEL